MTSIQQSFNQMLYSAQLGVGLYKQTPEAKQKAENKQLLKREAAQEAAYNRALADYEATHADLSPEELPGKSERERQRAESAASGLASIAEARYLRDPSEANWEAQYLAGVTADEYARQGGSASYIEKLKKNVVDRTKTIQEQRESMKTKRRIFANEGEDPFGGLWQRKKTGVENNG